MLQLVADDDGNDFMMRMMIFHVTKNTRITWLMHI